MSELQEIRNVFHGLKTLYDTYLPKIDPVLLHDLLIREYEKSERAPFYMVEVFTKPGAKIIYRKLLALFQQYTIKVLIM